MTFNEANSVRDLVRDQAVLGGWEFLPGADLDREYADVLIEADVRDALIRLNPTIAQQPDRADEVLHRLRAIILAGRSGSILAANEEFAAWLTGEKSMPFDTDGEHVTINLVDFENPRNDRLVVSTEVTVERGQVKRRFDLVFWVNGMPLVVGEAKSPWLHIWANSTRAASTTRVPRGR